MRSPSSFWLVPPPSVSCRRKMKLTLPPLFPLVVSENCVNEEGLPRWSPSSFTLQVFFAVDQLPTQMYEYVSAPLAPLIVNPVALSSVKNTATPVFEMSVAVHEKLVASLKAAEPVSVTDPTPLLFAVTLSATMCEAVRCVPPAV